MHDLEVFMTQATDKMASDYEWLTGGKTKDHAGLAGSQGEKHWKKLLQDWLPPYYIVETNGKIILENGDCLDKELDILILDSTYPTGLLNNNYYLSACVVAAFECKLTLRTDDIRNAFKNSKIIHEKLYKWEQGSPYKELHSPIIYGLLAHSHDWKSETSTPIENITDNLIKLDQEIITHPREMLDITCVADTGTWVAKKIRGYKLSGANFSDHYQPPATVYASSSKKNEDQKNSFTPIGVLITNLIIKLAYKDEKIRKLAEYYAKAMGYNANGWMRNWDTNIYSDEVKKKLTEVPPDLDPLSWSEWKMRF